MAWRVANSLLRLQDAVNTKWPGRDKGNDGFLGDSAHAARKSDHNPNAAGVVCAFDITHDPPTLDAHALADYLKSKGDKRVQYIISNKRIWNPDISSAWRPYTGSNGHTEHIHVSVRQKPDLYDDDAPWDIGTATTPTPAPTGPYPDFLRRGSLGEDVEVLQWLVGSKVDGEYGPNTVAAVQAFQKANGLTVDGIVGHLTWDRLRLLTLAKAPVVPPVTPPVTPTPDPVWLYSGKGSWYSQYRGSYTWVDTGDRPNSNALGVPDSQQGIALYDRSTLGKWFMVKAPNGKVLKLQQTDIGPHPNTGRKIDIAAVAAEAFGYSPLNFPTDKIFYWNPA